MVRPTIALLAALGGVLASVAACGSGGARDATGTGTLVIVASTTQLADFARVVGGDRATVVGLLKPNVDAHEYEASPADIERIRTAGVVVLNGLGLDSWASKAIDASGTKATIVTATDGVTVRKVDGEEDPHAWMDPGNAKVMVTHVAKAMAAADPGATVGYEDRLTAYTAQIDALDAEIEAKLAPLTNRKVVTNHDAFGYFLDRYRLTFVGSIIPSVDTQAELSAAELKDLVDLIRAEGVKAIFTEASLPPKTARTIAAEAGVKVVSGDAALYGDSLGAPGSGADTYLTMMRKNAAILADNLG
jgi:zinc/manganese transport system substrate-binding protein